MDIGGLQEAHWRTVLVWPSVSKLYEASHSCRPRATTARPLLPRVASPTMSKLQPLIAFASVRKSWSVSRYGLSIRKPRSCATGRLGDGYAKRNSKGRACCKNTGTLWCYVATQSGGSMAVHPRVRPPADQLESDTAIKSKQGPHQHSVHRRSREQHRIGAQHCIC